MAAPAADRFRAVFKSFLNLFRAQSSPFGLRGCGFIVSWHPLVAQGLRTGIPSLLGKELRPAGAQAPRARADAPRACLFSASPSPPSLRGQVSAPAQIPALYRAPHAAIYADAEPDSSAASDSEGVPSAMLAAPSLAPSPSKVAASASTHSSSEPRPASVPAYVIFSSNSASESSSMAL